ncbi:MAG: GTPase [Candidatus Hodarchaeales archaeon]|jgi:GTP-binding protein HflX
MQSIQKRENSSAIDKPVLICYLKVPEKPDTSDEFQTLVESAGFTVVELYKEYSKPDSSYYFTKGQIRKIQHALGRIRTARLVIFGTVLSPLQRSNLARKLKKYRIMDQFELILRLFGSRTNRKETIHELQLAALNYQFRFHSNFLLEQKFVLDQMGYGNAEDLRLLEIPFSRIGFHFAMKNLKKKIEHSRNQRSNQRRSRLKKADRGELASFSVVGYTNAGKSSFLNAFADSTLETSNKLFTTLSTRTRRVKYQDLPILLTDTVGFFQDLPDELIEPFNSTLEESLCSDVVLMLLDCSEPEEEINRKLFASFNVLHRIDTELFNRLWIILTKIDLVSNEKVQSIKDMVLSTINDQEVSISFNNEMIEAISSKEKNFFGFYRLLDKQFPETLVTLKIPFNHPEISSMIYDTFKVTKEQAFNTFWLLEINTRKSYLLDSIIKKFRDKLETV